MPASPVAAPTFLWISHGEAGGLDPRQFPAYAERQVTLGDLHLTLRVIGASSLVLARRGEAAWFELITCQDEAPGAVARVRSRLAVPGCAAVASARPDCTYEGRMWTLPLGRDPFSATLAESLEFTFPAPGDPATRIEAEATPQGFRLRTRHDYPELGAAVWSESEWRF